MFWTPTFWGQTFCRETQNLWVVVTEDLLTMGRHQVQLLPVADLETISHNNSQSNGPKLQG